jgi:hypothetical protein
LNQKLGILSDKLNAYKRKYYLNKLVKGTIFLFSAVLSTYLILNSIEFNFHMNSNWRTLMFFSFLFLFAFLVYFWILSPLVKILFNTKQISDEEAAIEIGKLFPNISDKLLNTIQLGKLQTKDNSLLSASLEQRTESISVFSFSSGIKLSTNKRYIKYAAYPGVVLLLLLFFFPHFLTESTERIINYNKEFAPKQLFNITVLNKSLTAFKNEDYTFKINVDGIAIPDNIYLNINGRRIKMDKIDANLRQYTFQKIQAAFEFQVEAPNYKSNKYLLNVYNRPDIKKFNIELKYPTYTSKNNEILSNTGNLLVPEGTSIKWALKTISTEISEISFSPDYKKIQLEPVDTQLYTYENRIYASQNYRFHLKNEHSDNRNQMEYRIDVLKDEFPKISLDTYQDTTLFSYMVLGGNISDDYGVRNLELLYKLNSDNVFESRKVPISKNSKSQNYFYQWVFDSLKLKEGDKLEYFVRVWDNDGVNGSKFTKTGTYQFKIPTKDIIKESIKKQAESTKSQLDKSIEKAQDLKKQIDEIQDKLKSKKALDWQDKKQLNELIQQKEKLEEDLKKLSQQNKAYNKKRERFSNQDKKLQEKANQLQKLMDEVLDEETKKLYDELKKLLEEQKSIDDVQDIMDQIENKENNVEKEIERAIELFKRLQFDYKMDDIVDHLEELSNEQDSLSEESLNKENDTEQLQKDQNELNEKFDDIKEELSELNELNENLKNPEDLDDFSKEEEDISEEQKNSSEQLEQKKRKKASLSQKKASEKMKKMQQKMQDMQAGMEMEMLQENLDNLRDIVDNLVKVSFDQEDIMQAFEGVNQSDPRYITLSQKQLKLRDDSKIIEDSLTALAGRVFQIASFVTRELDDMNDHIEGSLQALKDRKKPEAVSNQQFAMTSINNLALLLDDVLQQMQQQMADAMGKPKKGKGGKKQKTPGMSELQKQLNKQISDLKKSGKSGRKLSESLAKMAAQQEMIRKELEEMQQKLDEHGENGGGTGIKDAIQKMEQTEVDLVNKQITQQTIKRQQDILTRLLKAEDALRERELDNERKADKATNVLRNIPPAFQDYLKAKQQEIELLKTVPLKLNPYYKEEVNKYFKRLSQQ